MERITLRIPKEQLKDIDALVDAGEFSNRSQAIRAAIRDLTGEPHPEYIDSTAESREAVLSNTVSPVEAD